MGIENVVIFYVRSKYQVVEACECNTVLRIGEYMVYAHSDGKPIALMDEILIKCPNCGKENEVSMLCASVEDAEKAVKELNSCITRTP
ncbi:MAG: hypothetical protein G01um101429_340 [Parcubacteria group bacterium Gr01-1014_29]|nr:MAG: hypothetical protein G01um101429_340 [Parcubacteria group bacterium Gr01-1014_29]